MEKTLSALHQNNQDLSNADAQLSLDNKATHQDNLVNKPLVETTILQPYDPLEALNELIKETEQEAQKLKRNQERKKAIKKVFKWKLKKAENLNLAFAMLTKQKHKIKLIPNFDREAFIEAIEENLDYRERLILAKLVKKMYDELNDKINHINSFVDIELYYEYYTHKPYKESIYVTADRNGNPTYHHGVDEPTAEMIEMNAERDMLMSLSNRLDGMVIIKLVEEELSELQEALEV